ncbi:uncharacterized protein LOC124162052 [Ischnura elegans]|uniref:uncharacterized protein LOC124162052 n=1 Tax=Ischnura elegans TaxID=197161 RepID=UPI001ED877F1|nr:uncharacterized protein LOC124162052 [Ischnura elegans]
MLGLEMDPFPRELPPLAHHVSSHLNSASFHRLHFQHIVASRTPRRCLFGRADSSATRNALNRIFQEEAERCVKTWEFDPISGKPVENPKRFPWVKVPPATPEVPEERVAPATECHKPTAGIPFPGKENLVVPTVETSAPERLSEEGLRGRVMPATAGGVAEDPDSQVSERSREARRFAPYRQPRITEFWRQRKCSGDAKAKATITPNAVGVEDAETPSAIDGH